MVRKSGLPRAVELLGAETCSRILGNLEELGTNNEALMRNGVRPLDVCTRPAAGTADVFSSTLSDMKSERLLDESENWTDSARERLLIMSSSSESSQSAHEEGTGTRENASSALLLTWSVEVFVHGRLGGHDLVRRIPSATVKIASAPGLVKSRKVLWTLALD